MSKVLRIFDEDQDLTLVLASLERDPDNSRDLEFYLRWTQHDRDANLIEDWCFRHPTKYRTYNIFYYHHSKHLSFIKTLYVNN